MMKHIKLFENLETSKEDKLIEEIVSILGWTIDLDEVPYSRDEDTGENPSYEVTDNSKRETAKEIIKLLKKEGLI